MLLSCFQIALNNDAKCKDEGCYEVIKTLAELLEQRIKETDKVKLLLSLTQIVVITNNIFSF